MKCARVWILSALAAASAGAQPTVVVTGLPTPQKMIATAAGNLLVTGASPEPNMGHVFFVTPSGAQRELIAGLPSGIDRGTPAQIPYGPTAMALDGQTLFVAISVGDSIAPPESPAGSSYNPAGVSSPIFCSILEFRFSSAIDSIAGTFQLTPELQTALSDGAEVDLDDGLGASASVRVLVDLPDFIPHPIEIYKFSNPWGLALSADGETLYMTDASINALVAIDTSTGRWRRLIRFPVLPNIGPIGPPVVDSVPTSVRLYGSELLVSFLTGFPFTPGHARVLAVDPEDATTRPFIFWLTSAVDVLWREIPGRRPQFFVLEFSQNQAAQPPAPGRLLQYDSPEGRVMLDDLFGPVSLAFDESSETLFILELSGRILAVPIGSPASRRRQGVYSKIS